MADFINSSGNALVVSFTAPKFLIPDPAVQGTVLPRSGSEAAAQVYSPASSVVRNVTPSRFGSSFSVDPGVYSTSGSKAPGKQMYGGAPGLHDAYKVFVHIKSGVEEIEIVSALQDGMTINQDSTWSPLMVTEKLNKYVDFVLRFVAGKSPHNVVSSRRVWHGTSPVSIILTMAFRAFSNPNIEVLAAVSALQQLSAPFAAVNNNQWSPLVPPGPSPYRWGDGDARSSGVVSAGHEGEVVDIDVGNFLHFDSVVVKNVKVLVPPRFSAKLGGTEEGTPMSADVQIEFETYTILTKEAVKKMYEMRPHRAL